MSWLNSFDLVFGDVISCDLIDMIIVLCMFDFGGFLVRCVLFLVKCCMVGFFIFFD